MEKELRILILEDVPTDAELMERELRRANLTFSSKRVDTKEAFVKELKDFAPDIILSDYSLPQFNAIEALQLLREHAYDMPLVLVTGSLGEEAAVECIKSGAKDYILKSSLKRLSTAVLNALEKKEGERNQARFAAIIEATTDFVGISDTNGRALYINRAGRKKLGIGDDKDISNIRLEDALPEWARALVLKEGIPAALRDGAWSGETALNGHGGQEVAVLQVIVAPRTPRGNVEFFATIMRDITERKRAEEVIQTQLRRLASLRSIDLAITASLDLRVTLNVLLEQVTAQLGVDAAGVLLINPQTQTLEHIAGRGFRTGALRHTRLLMGNGYAGQAALERRTIMVPNLVDAPNEFIRAPLFAKEEFQAYYAVPLIGKGRTSGVLEIFHRSALDPDQAWRDFLDALAGQAAIAIDEAELFDNLQRKNIELTLAYDETLEGWSRALDMRDKETEGHSKRVTEMAVRLARAVGMREQELAHVRRGALLHDIGKLGIPDSILLKPEQLKEQEWEIMKKHPVYAFQMLSPIAYLRQALDIPYCHHEKWDGTGYPRGLKGEEIPQAARIFALVDVWDALRSTRPYRPPWPEERTTEYINEQAGKYFDPGLKDAFLKMVQEE